MSFVNETLQQKKCDDFSLAGLHLMLANGRKQVAQIVTMQLTTHQFSSFRLHWISGLKTNLYLSHMEKCSLAP